jgi:Domain of unknown function (DUF4136)
MRRLLFAVCVAALVVSSVANAQKPAPAGVSVLQQDQATDFSKIRTYEWGPGHKAIDPAYDKAITAAIDAQLAAKGWKKASPADVIVAYHTVERIDVDLSTFDDKPPAPGAQRAMAQMVHVGTLVVDLKAPATHKILWRVSGEGVVTKMAPAARDQFVSGKVASLFEAFPSPKK